MICVFYRINNQVNIKHIVGVYRTEGINELDCSIMVYIADRINKDEDIISDSVILAINTRQGSNVTPRFTDFSHY